MKLVKMDELFDIIIAKSNDRCHLEEINANNINALRLVGRTKQNNGVLCWVNKNKVSKIYTGPVISVPMVGSVCQATIQEDPFCCTQNIALCYPKKKIQSWEMMYYCEVIELNQFKYSYGRSLSLRTLRDTQVPAEVPEWANIDPSEAIKAGEEKAAQLLKNAEDPIDTTNWQWFYLTDLFNAEVGNAPSVRVAEENPGNTPYVSASENNNGIACYTSLKANTPVNVLTITKNGAVGKAFYQDTTCLVNADVMVLHPKFELNKNRGLFLIPLIELNKIKYSYGRKLNLKRLSTDKIKLPVKSDGSVDWDWIDEFMKGVKL